MADDNKLIPKNLDEIVVPVGKINLITTKEEVDSALEIAGRIFRQKEQQMDSTMNEELERDLVENETTESTTEETMEKLITLTDEQLAALPAAKYGRDVYGRALNKDGTPRKGRSDKGKSRGNYSPRTLKNVPSETVETT